jgi:hypothetical protein
MGFRWWPLAFVVASGCETVFPLVPPEEAPTVTIDLPTGAHANQPTTIALQFVGFADRTVHYHITSAVPVAADVSGGCRLGGRRVHHRRAPMIGVAIVTGSTRSRRASESTAGTR